MTPLRGETLAQCVEREVGNNLSLDIAHALFESIGKELLKYDLSYADLAGSDYRNLMKVAGQATKAVVATCAPLIAKLKTKT